MKIKEAYPDKCAPSDEESTTVEKSYHINDKRSASNLGNSKPSTLLNLSAGREDKYGVHDNTNLDYGMLRTKLQELEINWAPS